MEPRMLEEPSPEDTGTLLQVGMPAAGISS